MEHRTSPDDVVPRWYKRGAYIAIIAVVAFILIYAVYILVFVPAQPPPPFDNSTIGYLQQPP